MSVLIVYTLECHCGEEAEIRCLDTANPQPDGTIRIDIEMAAGQQTFDCYACGCSIYTGDVDTFTEPEECPGKSCQDCGEPEDDCTCGDDEEGDD